MMLPSVCVATLRGCTARPASGREALAQSGVYPREADQRSDTHRKRGVRCASFRGERLGASAVLGSSRRWVARCVCGAMGFVHDPLD
jgi:hypothetical protein